jgi:4-hydroxybutyrate CoA-transferase
MLEDQTTILGWQDHYRRHVVTAEQAIANVQDGDNVFTTIGHNVDILIAAMIGSEKRLRWTPTAATDLRWLTPELAEQIQVNTGFAMTDAREALNDFRADFTPWWFQGGYKALEDGRPGARSIDVSMFRVTPPNRAGWCCFGNSLWDVKFTATQARTSIAVVSDDLPRTFGDTWIRATDIDWFVEVEQFPAISNDMAARYREGQRTVATQPVARAIAGHVASIVRDGDTLQVGTGSMTASLALAGAFDDKNDLGYFAELTVPGIIELVQRGVITGRRLETHPGKVVTTMAAGLPEDLAVLHENPAFEFYGYEYMHDPSAIARNDNMVAINNALVVDLTGQVAAGQLGTKIWSGTGGQLSYHLGAFLSRGGRAVTVLPSTAKDGTISRITAEMPAGQIVTIPRDLSDLVVTEYGVADLLNKSQRERARALIEIAHPMFRDELRAQAKGLYGA